MENEHLDALMFFEGRPRAYSLYKTFLSKLTVAVGEYNTEVQKTQITLSNKRVFACVSQMKVRRKAELPPDYIVITFGLNRPLESPRIAAKTEPYPERWTHHVVISSPDEIDGELTEWVREAYTFSAAKR